jgi:cobalt-zinc-cadmium efflux system membrane fusion protein
MSRRYIWLAAVGVVAVTAVIAMARARSSSEQPVAAVQQPKKAGDAVVRLRPDAAARNPVTTTKVARVKMAGDLELVGSVAYDQDHFAVVGPLIDGRVSKLRAAVGDKVAAGQVLAEIESAEVGQAQAAFLSAAARAQAADANAVRERELAAQRVSSTREREAAEAVAVSEAAEVRAAVERLRAYGAGEAELAALKRGQPSGGRVPLRAPIAGTVVARAVTLGQAVERATDAFKIADLSHLWVNLDLYEKDLSRVRAGQEVEVRAEAFPGEVFRGRVAYVVPMIDEATRTAKVRLEFENRQAQLSLGQLVTARIVGDGHRGAPEVLAVPRDAVERVDGRPVVFVAREAGAFQQRAVELGASGGDLVEIRTGLTAGELVAIDGAFLLKSELLR